MCVPRRMTRAPIYIGRRFKNDTERLEKLFDLHTKMTAAATAKPVTKAARRTKT